MPSTATPNSHPAIIVVSIYAGTLGLGVLLSLVSGWENLDTQQTGGQLWLLGLLKNGYWEEEEEEEEEEEGGRTAAAAAAVVVVVAAML